MFNYAAPGAHVGLQVDGDVVIQGGITLETPARPAPGSDSDSDRPGRGRADRGRAVNTAQGSDTVGVQAQNITVRPRHR